MKEIDPALLTDIQSHAGCPVPIEAVEIVYDDAKSISKQREIPLEFAIAEKVKSLYAAGLGAHQRSASKATFNFADFCKLQLAPKDNLFGKIFKKRDKVAAAQAELQELELAITSAKTNLRASELKVTEIQNHIANAESDLQAQSPEAVEASIQKAANIWHLKHQSPHNASVIQAALEHALDSEIVIRILNRRLIDLREALVLAKATVEGFKKQLKDLE